MTAPSAGLYEVETALRAQGLRLICGVDEAGRGPLAGPVVAGAVILPEGLTPSGLNDSKKLTEQKRELLYGVLIERATAWAVGVADQREIDDVNILQATFLAMRRAVEGLGVTPERLLVDGNRDPALGLPTETFVKGDGRIACIAAASILAKVTRDRMLAELDRRHPEYGFTRHKGYPTKAHYEAIERYGVLPEHRMSFLKKHG